MNLSTNTNNNWYLKLTNHIDILKIQVLFINYAFKLVNKIYNEFILKTKKNKLNVGY